MVRAVPMVVKGVNIDRPVPVVVQGVTRTEMAQWLFRRVNKDSWPSGCLGVTRTELAQ